MVVDGQADMDYTTHTVVNEYYDIDSSKAIKVRVKFMYSPF
jgi:hypothetical protein